MINKIHILHKDQIHPEMNGAFLRTFNLAKLASEEFKTSIYGVDEKIEYQNIIDSIQLIQEKKYGSVLKKLKHFSDGLFSKEYSLWYPKIVFDNYNLETDIIQVEGPFLYNYLRKKGIKKFILDEHNVYWELSKFPNFNFKYKLYYKLASNRDKTIEINAIKNASHILVCSKRDKYEISKELPDTEEKITVIPNGIDFSEYDAYLKFNKTKMDDTKIKILFMGLLSYSPNIDAVNVICEKIAPLFTYDEVEFIIIGKNPPNHYRNTNVKFLGYVDDLKKYIMDSTICIAPLRYGSGTRFKILEYMAMGKPIISTTKGAEGIDYIHNENILIEDNLDNFANKIKELINNKKIRKKLGKNALELVKNQYDWKIYKDTLCNVYDEVLNEI